MVTTFATHRAWRKHYKKPLRKIPMAQRIDAILNPKAPQRTQNKDV